MNDAELNKNLAAFVAELFRREADHWDAEYEQLTHKHGAYGATKVRAAWKLGAGMLRRRAADYETGTVSYLRDVDVNASGEAGA